MEKKNKKRLIGRILAAVVLVLISVLYIFSSIFAVKSFALPYYGAGYSCEYPITLQRLSSRNGGTQFGQFYSIPDAFNGNGSYSAYVTQSDHISANDNITVSYRSSLDEYTDGHEYIYNEKRYKYYYQLIGSNPNDSSVTGSLVVSKPNIPSSLSWHSFDQDVEFLQNGYLMRMDSMIYCENSSIVFWINFPQNSHLKWGYAIEMVGYNTDGNVQHYRNVGWFNDAGSTWARISLGEMVSSVVVQNPTARIMFQDRLKYGLISTVRIYPIWDDGDSSTLHQVNFNWLRCYCQKVADDTELVRARWQEEYTAGVSRSIYSGQAGENYFVNTNWFSWLGNAVSGVMDVHLFGPNIPFTMGGLLAIMVSFGVVCFLVKVFR